MQQIVLPVEITVEIDETKLTVQNGKALEKKDREIAGLKSRVEELQRQRDELFKSNKESSLLLEQWNLDSKTLKERLEALLRIIKKHSDSLSYLDKRLFEQILNKQDSRYRIGL